MHGEDDYAGRLNDALAKEALLTLSADNRILAATGGTTSLLRVPEEDLTGSRFFDLFVDEDIDSLEATVIRATTRVQGVGPLRTEAQLAASPDEAWVDVAIVPGPPDDGGAVATAVLTDITRFKLRERQLESNANIDSLTGLPNQLLLLDRAAQALARVDRTKCLVGAILIDVDRFGPMRDTHGQAAADRVIAELANRLRIGLRPSDSVARYASDVFVVLCEGLANAEEAAVIADRVLDLVRTPILVGLTEVSVSASAGIALVDDTDIEPATLIHQAHRAMYRAKQHGRDRFEFYATVETNSARTQLVTERALMHALDRDELEVWYQPTIDLRTGQRASFEALLRWNNPDRGLIGPDEIIPIAERTGQIREIGAWVLAEACAQFARWHDHFPSAADLRLNVNVSALQLEDGSIVGDISNALAETGLPADRLVVELTESQPLLDSTTSGEALLALKAMGVLLALDDFGTGYSALDLLPRKLFDILKIDGSLMIDIGALPERMTVVNTVVTMAHELEMQSIAEGVESAADLERLRNIGCDLAQGYFIGRPTPAAEVRELLAEP